MLIREASQTLNESPVAGAILATNDDGWVDGFATEIGIVILIFVWLVLAVTKPFRRKRESQANPFEPHDGPVYMAVTESRIVFFEIKQGWWSAELGSILSEHVRTTSDSITRNGKTVKLNFPTGEHYDLFWTDSQFAWENVVAKLSPTQSKR